MRRLHYGQVTKEKQASGSLPVEIINLFYSVVSVEYFALRADNIKDC